MIKGIVGGGHIIVNGNTGFGPYVNMSNPSAGMVRYNGSSQNLEVYDGSSWMIISSDMPSINLDSGATSAIHWAMKKMAEEAEIERLSEQHPAVKAAYENVKRAAEQLKATIILSKDEQTTS